MGHLPVYVKLPHRSLWEIRTMCICQSHPKQHIKYHMWLVFTNYTVNWLQFYNYWLTIAGFPHGSKWLWIYPRHQDFLTGIGNVKYWGEKNGARDFSKTDRRTNLGSVGDLNCWTHWILVCLIYFKIGTALLADIVEIYLLYTS